MTTEEIVTKITGIINDIIVVNVDYFREEETFKVRPGYGYDKFFLNWIFGGYDMSLQSLIYYIMYEEGLYKEILNERQYADLEKVIENYPEAIYSLEEDDEDPLEYERIDDQLFEIFFQSIRFVGNRLIELGFDVEGDFTKDYLGHDK